MKKLFSLFALGICLLLQVSVQAQSKQNATRKFLKQLNEIVTKSSEPWPWEYAGKYTVDSFFSVSKTGVLSITFRYTTNTAFTRIRMTAPVSKIQDVFYDYYLGFQFADDWVTVYQSVPGNKKLAETHKDHLFHIGLPSFDGYQQQENLQKALVELQKFYKE